METSKLEILQQLDEADQEKVFYFLKLLLNQNKYREIRKELAQRKNEIKNQETLSHDEIWKNLGV